MWVAFVLVHAWLAIANAPAVSGAFGDVRLVYPFWLEQGLGDSWVGVDEPWVYPILAWLPILLAGIAGPGALPVVWIVMITAMNAAATWALARQPRGTRLAWVWIGFLALLGPIAIGRIDAVTVPLVLVAVVLLRHDRAGLAAALVTIAAWMKVWPGVVLLAMLLVRRERWRILAVGAGVSTVVMGVALALGSGHVLSFLTEQGTRGLQIESVAATPFVWLASAGAATLYFDADILTFQVRHAAAGDVAAILTPVLVVCVAVVLALGAWALRRGEDRRSTIVWLVLALVTALIVCNKVGSPQFVAWLAVPAVLLAERGVRAHGAWLVTIAAIAALTNAIYPWWYGLVVAATPFGVALLSLRNAMEVGLLVAAIVMLVRAGRRRGALSSTR